MINKDAENMVKDQAKKFKSDEERRSYERSKLHSTARDQVSNGDQKELFKK